MTEIRDIKDRSPNPDLIAMLEDRLERAKAGDIRSAVIVTSADDNATGHGWVMDARTWQQPILAQMLYAQNEIMLRMSLVSENGILRGATE